MKDEKLLEIGTSRPPLNTQASIADPCAAFRRASRALTRFYDLVLAPASLKATQFITLRTIEQHGEIAQWQLSKEYAIAPETLSRRLAVLRDAGLLNMRIGTRRRGERMYSVTPAGISKLRLAEPYWIRAQQRLGAAMGVTDLHAAVEAADRLVFAARKAEAAKVQNVSVHAWITPSIARYL